MSRITARVKSTFFPKSEAKAAEKRAAAQTALHEAQLQSTHQIDGIRARRSPVRIQDESLPPALPPSNKAKLRPRMPTVLEPKAPVVDEEGQAILSSGQGAIDADPSPAPSRASSLLGAQPARLAERTASATPVQAEPARSWPLPANVSFTGLAALVEATVAHKSQSQPMTEAEKEAAEQRLMQGTLDGCGPALKHMSGLSSKSSRLNPAHRRTEQYRFAKEELDEEQRTVMAACLEEIIKGSGLRPRFEDGTALDISEGDALQMWLAVQQARLRTHTPEQHDKYKEKQYVRRLGSGAALVGMPVLLLLGSAVLIGDAFDEGPKKALKRVGTINRWLLKKAAWDAQGMRNKYKRDEARPESDVAFLSFVNLAGDTTIDPGLRNEAIRVHIDQFFRKEKILSRTQGNTLAAALGEDDTVAKRDRVNLEEGARSFKQRKEVRFVPAKAASDEQLEGMVNKVRVWAENQWRTTAEGEDAGPPGEETTRPDPAPAQQA